MTTRVTTRRQFRIERLEDRVAPNSLLWQGGLVEAIVGGGALCAGFSAGQAHRAARLSDAARVANGDAATQAARTVFPAWAETLLMQIEQELDRSAAPAGAPAPVAQPCHSARLDELMLQVDQGLRNSARSVDGPPAVNSEKMPSWAEDLLLEIQLEVAQTQGARRPRAAMAGPVR